MGVGMKTAIAGLVNELKGCSKIYKIILVGCFLCLGASLILFIPQIRELIILFVEKIIGRTITHSFWHSKILKYEILFIFTDLILLLVLFLRLYPEFYNSDSEGVFHTRNEIMKLAKSKTTIITLFCVFSILVGIRFFYITQKKSLHVDEGLEISICNRNEVGFYGKSYEQYKEYTGKELKEISLFNNDSIKDSFSDIIHSYKDSIDPPHTNFYHTCFRLWFTGVKTTDLNYIIWHGCLLNLIFFTVSFALMVLLLRRFIQNPAAVALCLLIAFLNPASMSLTVFLRDYELQQIFVILLTYYVTCIFQAITDKKQIETKKNFVIGVFVLAFTMLAAYLDMILIGLYGLFIIILCIKMKKWNLLKFFIFMFVTSLVTAKLLYLNFGNVGERGAQAGAMLSLANIYGNIIATKNGFQSILFKNVFFAAYIIFFIVSSILTFLACHKKTTWPLSAIIFINILSVILFMYFVPLDLKTLRYTAPLYSIFSLSFLASPIKCKEKYTLAMEILVVCFLFLSIFPFNKRKSVVEHLDDSNIENYKPLQENELPVFIQGDFMWKYSCLIPYLKDNNKIIFIKHYEELLTKYSDQLPCIFILQNNDSGFLTPKSVLMNKLTSIPYHDVYLLKE